MKKYQGLLFTILLLVTASTAIAQSPTPTPDDDTVRITTSLIQLDVVVTDNKGEQVKDLKPGDFLVYQDGKPQQVSNLSYIDVKASQKTTVSVGTGKPDKRQIAPPRVPIHSVSGRIITFVLDDGNCLSSPDTLATIRDAARKFIDRQMRPDDKVAIYRTRTGASLLQVYTSNKELLKREVNRVSLITPGNCGSSFEAIRDKSTLKYTGSGASSFESAEDAAFRKDVQDRDRENQVLGTIGVMNFVVDRLKNVPQRKIVFLLSEGITAKFDSRTNDALRELADRAGRSSVVINTMSAKGVTVPGFLSAQDEVLPGVINGSDNTGQAEQDRVEEEALLNQGISYLAYATGGKFVRNSNFLDADVEKILDADTGYYLIGYEPTEETFKGKGFHRIEVRVNRPGLQVTSRKGFFGRPDADFQTVYKTADSPLFQAISSPFLDAGINIRLTTLMTSDQSGNNALRALLHIPGEDLTMAEQPDGSRKTTLDVVAVMLNEKGKVVEEFNRSYPITIPGRGVSTVLRNGLDFSTDIAVKRPGPYTFRIAVRDEGSKKIGTAGDFVDVPDTAKGSFRIGGLSTAEINKSGLPVAPPRREINAAFSPVLARSTPAVRQFTKGTFLPYAFTIYNARPDPATGRPNLTKEIRIYAGDKLLTSGEEKPIDLSAQPDPKRLEISGFLRLGEALEPGDYVLQIIVRDKVSDRASAQWIDFEVIP